jgi:hypothetical protein
VSNKKQSVLSQTPHLQRWRGLFFLALCQRLLADQHPNASYLPSVSAGFLVRSVRNDGYPMHPAAHANISVQFRCLKPRLLLSVGYWHIEHTPGGSLCCIARSVLPAGVRNYHTASFTTVGRPKHSHRQKKSFHSGTFMAQKIPFGSKCYLAHTLLPKTSKAGNNLGQHTS